MPRKLKTFITNLGFFELAVAAPSMKAALEAWGMSHNAFAHGFARQTDDADIIAVTEAQPGVVLKRPVGSDEAFTQNPDLPKSLPALKPPPRPAKKARAAKPAKKKTHSKSKPGPASVTSFEKARAKREKARARQEAQQEKERTQRRRETEKAQAALDAARERHDAALDEIARERGKLDRREEKENARWEEQRRRLKDDVDQAGR